MSEHTTVYYRTYLERGVYCTLGKAVQRPKVIFELHQEPGAPEIPYRELEKVLGSFRPEYPATWEQLTHKIVACVRALYEHKHKLIYIKITFCEYYEEFTASYTWTR